METINHILQSLRHFFIQVNVFETDETHQAVLYIQRWSTRVYICLLVFFMCILIGYNIIVPETQQIEVQNPSLDTYLKLQNVYTDIQCISKEISLPYGLFVELIPFYHPICSSDFISQNWIDILFDNMTTTRYAGDFRATSFNQFQVLRELCKQSKTILNDDFQTFYQQGFISSRLFTENLMKATVMTMIDQFQSQSRVNFEQILSFTRYFVLTNGLMPGIQTAHSFGTLFGLPAVTSNNYVPLVPFTYGCDCTFFFNCSLIAAFYDTEARHIEGTIGWWWFESDTLGFVDNWYVGCWALESLLLSSVDASLLYNQTTLNTIGTYFESSSSSFKPHALNKTSRKNNLTFSDLVQNLFLENMSININYSLYYEQSQVQSCSYTVKQRSSVLYIITSILSLYGGLTVILRLLVPKIVTIAIKWSTRATTIATVIDVPETTMKTTLGERSRALRGLIWDSLIELNMFKSPFQQQPSDIRKQRLTTRLYICVLILAFFILTLFTSMNIQEKVINVNEPSFSDVLYLQSQNEFNSSLHCPCTQLTTSYRQIVRLEPFYHQVCIWDTSAWDWGVYLNSGYLIVGLGTDALTFSSNVFKILSTVCMLSNKTIFNSLKTFEQTQLVTGQLLTAKTFEYQMTSVIEQFKLETLITFLRFLQLFRNITFINQYLNGRLSNFKYDISPVLSLSITGFTNGNLSCSCAQDINCRTQYGLYSPTTGQRESFADDFYQACWPVESLLQSSLQCFFDDQDCFARVKNTYGVSLPNIKPLNSSLKSRYSTNTSISILLTELFVEYWNQSLNYSSYFDQCHPVLCTYKISRRNNLLETIIIIIGLVGGLFAILRILVSLFVTICFYFIGRQQQSSPSSLFITTAQQESYLQELFQVYNGLDTVNAPHNAYTLEGTIFSHFQALRVLLSLIKDAAEDGIERYLTSSVIFISMLDSNTLSLELNASLANFKLTLPNAFLNSFDLIRSIGQANGFVSGYATNWYLFAPDETGTNGEKLYFHPQTYGSNCTCATSASCTQPSIPFITGYVVGCTPLEALLRSSIECLYTQTCINQLAVFLNISSQPKSLNSSQTRFFITDTIESIVQEMFIETCSSNVLYDKFFAQCHPLTCTITLVKRNSPTNVLVTMIALYGGLTKFLKLLIPIFFSIIYNVVLKYKQQAQMRVSSISPVENT
ncbi:hypothetical protein I4U23_011277 [Adineta vaga]|nr:hypothetical protein I4U23_011277 [Adineta vaga]